MIFISAHMFIQIISSVHKLKGQKMKKIISLTEVPRIPNFLHTKQLKAHFVYRKLLWRPFWPVYIDMSGIRNGKKLVLYTGISYNGRNTRHVSHIGQNGRYRKNWFTNPDMFCIPVFSITVAFACIRDVSL